MINLLKNIKMDKSYSSFFNDESNLKNLKNIENILDKKDFFPNEENVLRFLTIPLPSLKCVILGMDPYPSYYTKNGIIAPIATGRSFEVSNIYSFKEKFKQTSLTNILKTFYYGKTKQIKDIQFIKTHIVELQIKDVNALDITKLKNDYLYILNPKDFFDYTEKQGVLWLNATLTVKKNTSGSHKTLWKDFMNEIIKYIVDNTNDLKWLIWGKDAYEKVIDKVSPKNIIYTNHPSSRVNNTFITDNCFDNIKDIKWYF